MVNYCVCAYCTNSSLSGHRVHTFPLRKSNGGGVFRAWVRFVQVRRRDFNAASVGKNSVVCGAHFREEDYVPGDMIEFRMGFRSQDRVRLIPGAVPSVHSALSVPSTSAASASGASSGKISHRTSTDSARWKREMCMVS